LAGLAADVRAAAAADALVAPVAAVLTAQGPEGVRRVRPVDPSFLAEQLRAALDSLPVAALKIGLLHSAAQLQALLPLPALPCVLDPVLASSRGGSLVLPDYLPALRPRLAAVCSLLTPNLPECEALLGRPLRPGRAGLEEAAAELLRLGAPAVLLKGGHLDGGESPDLLAEPEGLTWLEGPRVPGGERRGTGCSLATWIAVELARGAALPEACAAAKRRLREALEAPPPLQGPGGLPLLVG
jgi:hydroxymethylpyrimidine/phosphomethylpyrimidine kinase